mgnify:CR=1 FL=1
MSSGDGGEQPDDLRRVGGANAEGGGAPASSGDGDELAAEREKAETY